MSEKIMSHDEMRACLRLYRGQAAKYRPQIGESSRSTKITIWDIRMLTGTHRHPQRIFNYIKGAYKPGKKVSARMSKIIRLVEAGRITKTQFGVYHWHDVAPVKPKARMRIAIGANGVSLLKTPQVQEKEFPNFNKVFGGK